MLVLGMGIQAQYYKIECREAANLDFSLCMSSLGTERTLQGPKPLTIGQGTADFDVMNHSWCTDHVEADQFWHFKIVPKDNSV